MEQPFLFKFLQPCSTQNEINEKFVYDEDSDMMALITKEGLMPAINVQGKHIPGTKKADIEKGEDAKDTLMWK